MKRLYLYGPPASGKSTWAKRLQEETGLEADYMKQIGTWTKKGRDPRGPVHTTAFLFVPKDPFCAIPGDDASSLQWMDIRVSSDTDNDGQLYVELTGEGGNGKVTIICSRETDKYGIESVSVRHVASSEGLNGLAFDHAEIIATAFVRLLSFDLRKLVFYFLPEKFTLSNYIDVYQYLTKNSVEPGNIPNFRRQLTATKDPILVPCEGEFETEGKGHAKAQLFRRNPAM